MDSQHSNYHLLEVNVNQNSAQGFTPMNDIPVATSMWNRDTTLPGSGVQPPCHGQDGWYLGSLIPVPTQPSLQNAGMEDQASSNLKTVPLVASVQSATAGTEAAAELPSNDSQEDVGDENASSDNIMESSANDGAGGVSKKREKEETFMVPRVLWPQEMVDLHARTKYLSSRLGRRKYDTKLIADLKAARSKFKSWFRKTQAEMREMPNFEELKTMAIEESKKFHEEKLKRKAEQEQERLKKRFGSSQVPGLLGEPPLMSTPPPGMPGAPLIPGKALLPTPEPQGPVQGPNESRRAFIRRMKRSPYYSYPFNRPRFPGRKPPGFPPVGANSEFPPVGGNPGFPPVGDNSGFPPVGANSGFPPVGANSGFPAAVDNTGFPPDAESSVVPPEPADSYMHGYRYGFVAAAAEFDSEPSSSQFNQGHHCNNSSGW